MGADESADSPIPLQQTEVKFSSVIIKPRQEFGPSVLEGLPK